MQCRITALKEDISQGANCGMYSMKGHTTADAASGQHNVTVQVSGLYDVTNVLNVCSGQADAA